MRTNIVLDDNLIAEAMKYSKARSKRGVVKEALATYITVKAEQQRTESYRERLAIVRKRMADSSLRKSAMAMLKDDRAGRK